MIKLIEIVRKHWRFLLRNYLVYFLIITIFDIVFNPIFYPEKLIASKLNYLAYIFSNYSITQAKASLGGHVISALIFPFIMLAFHLIASNQQKEKLQTRVERKKVIIEKSKKNNE